MAIKINKKKLANNFFLPFIGIICSINLVIGQNWSPTQIEFGQNRIQKKEFRWKTITSANFEIYFYNDGQGLANYAAQYAESEFERLTNILGYSPYSRTKMFLYSSPAEMFQSNVNLNLTGDINPLESNLSKSKIEISYPGELNLFKKEILQKISEIFVYEMLYGGSLKDALQSSILLTLPEWFISGVAAYSAEGWSPEMDGYMRDAILKKRVKKPENLSGKEARLVGLSIWNFISEKYGKDNISNILNLTRIIRNEQTSIGSTLGTSYSRFLKDWRDYYANGLVPLDKKYNTLRTDFKIPGFSYDKELTILSPKLSLDQSFIAYVINDNGRFFIEEFNVKTKKKIRLMSIGYKASHKGVQSSLPLIGWAKENTLAIVYEKDGQNRLQIFSNITSEKPYGKVTLKKVLKGFQQITDFDISDNASTLIISGDKKNQSDLFLYDVVRGNTTQITNDLYDDRQPSFVGSSKSNIVFLSNRLKDSLNVDKGTLKSLTNNFSIFFHDGNPKAEMITRLVDSLGNVSRPKAINDSTVVFISDEKGIKNLYRYIKIDSTLELINQLTNSISNIYDYDINTNTGATVFNSEENGSSYLGYMRRLDFETGFELPNVFHLEGKPNKNSTLLPKEQAFQPEVVSETSEVVVIKEKSKYGPGEIDTENYVFESGNVIAKSDVKTTKIIKNSSPGVIIRSNNRKDTRIKGPVDFKDKYELINIDNEIIYDPIRKLGLKYTAVFSDLLQNEILKAGLMATPSLKNGDIFGEYFNYKRRYDFGARVDRRTYQQGVEDNLGRKIIYNKISATISYPINVVNRISLTPFFINTASKFLNASQPNAKSNFTGWNINYVYDNTSQLALNSIEGTKISAQYQNVRGATDALESFNKFTLDLRHYEKLPKDIILATRLSYGNSQGNSPKQFMLGGMDNWLVNVQEIRNNSNNPLYDADQSIDNRNAIMFGDFVTNLRGFNVNKVSGSNHFLVNAEFRFPLFKYLSTKPINSNFLKNFQAIVFTDFGTVWNKRNPFQKKNDFNTKPIENSSPFTGLVTDFKSPLLASYGLGARSVIFGYFVKFDIGWGVEDNEVLKPITMFSLGHDF